MNAVNTKHLILIVPFVVSRMILLFIVHIVHSSVKCLIHCIWSEFLLFITSFFSILHHNASPMMHKSNLSCCWGSPTHIINIVWFGHISCFHQVVFGMASRQEHEKNSQNVKHHHCAYTKSIWHSLFCHAWVDCNVPNCPALASETIPQISRSQKELKCNKVQKVHSDYEGFMAVLFKE